MGLDFTNQKTSVRGRKTVAELGKLLIADPSVRVHLTLLEKQYEIAIRIVETYFDPDMNPLAPAELGSESLRRKLATVLHQILGEELLTGFMDALRNDDVRRLADVGCVIASRMRLHADSDVHRASTVFERGAENPYRFGEKLPGMPPGFEHPNPAISGYLPMVRAIDADLQREQTRASLIVDEDLHYGAIFDQVLVDYGPGGRFVEGARGFGATGPITQIDSRVQHSSHTSMGIQLADLAAGMAHSVAVPILLGRSASQELLRIWEPWQQLAARTSAHWTMLCEQKRSRLPFVF